MTVLAKQLQAPTDGSAPPATPQAADRADLPDHAYRDVPLRIAVIGGRGIPCSYSGVERICEDLFTWFAARGHHVTVYCRPHVLSEPRGVHRGVRLVRTPSPGGKNFETLSHSYLSLRHALRRGDVHDGGKPFDLISFHAQAPNLFAPIARRAGVPVVSHVHGLDWQREKWKGLGSRVIHAAEKRMVRHASRVVVVNRGLVDYFARTYNIQTALLPNGIYPVSDHFQPDMAVLRRFGLEPGRFVVCVGRLVPEKRIHDTLTAFARLDTRFKLAIVGEGKHSPDYVAQLHALGARDGRVVFTGLQTGDALESIFRSAALYVTASELEGLPSSLLECMDRARPAVVSDIAPHRELFGAIEGYPWFFPHGDVDALATHLQHALANETLRTDLGRRQREFVRAHYAWPVLAERTEALYRDVAASVRPIA